MEQQGPADGKRMELRYAGVCRICGAVLQVRTAAIYERTSKTVRCLTCDPVPIAAPDLEDPSPSDPPPEVEIGTPGSSARREFERRKDGREERIRAKHPKLGGLIVSLSDDPQSTRAWDVGAVGEERLGRRLNELANDTLQVLHDRRIPRSRANIDHLAVTPSGVWVIDAKRYRGRPSLKVEGGLLRPRRERLMVGPRDCTKLVDSMLKQIEVVTMAIGNAVSVHGVLCFVEADWPLLGGGPFLTRDVLVTPPKKLYPRLSVPGPLDATAIDELHRRIAAALPVA